MGQGFLCKVRTDDALTAEAWGLLLGLEAWWNLGLRKIEAESDALQLVQLVNAGKHKEFRTEPWIRLNNWLERDWEVRILHTLREGNKCADKLASLCRHQREEVIYWRLPPEEIIGMLQDDQAGVGGPRVLSSLNMSIVVELM